MQFGRCGCAYPNRAYCRVHWPSPMARRRADGWPCPTTAEAIAPCAPPMHRLLAKRHRQSVRVREARARTKAKAARLYPCLALRPSVRSQRPAGRAFPPALRSTLLRPTAFGHAHRRDPCFCHKLGFACFRYGAQIGQQFPLRSTRPQTICAHPMQRLEHLLPPAIPRAPKAMLRQAEDRGPWR